MPTVISWNKFKRISQGIPERMHGGGITIRISSNWDSNAALKEFVYCIYEKAEILDGIHLWIYNKDHG